ncbi:5-methylthioribulose-1-phosphate isomerase [Rhodovastum atsumiense]|uniref:Ribulose 1,5-bisphosphate carboxylase n=1 Tax=Rhodovastum atsumiense TaxID=504468 RepID=A0A5M6ISF8_9PROT|nr:RuBisCO large subunit C-terminal-like domain-containing protein [Rhodovastum atsumiense]KAA5611246.1 ribulose 1,5-bisphosphate carboxylase [Rhodovastum atsumiense]CAH2603982.1 5-methylthioribulose-1-phosphate isomerase [Rhodovastum atsumiense]
MSARFHTTYHVTCPASEIEARARGIAVEQSVEMPLAAIEDERVMAEIVGQVAGIRELTPGAFEVRVALAVETVGEDAGQMLNMILGNSSMHACVSLVDVEIAPEFEAAFGGPRHGIEGLRARVGAGARPLTCTAIKPQGMPVDRLAKLAHKLALGGLDYIKDDHSHADQAFSPFMQRVPAIAAAVRQAAAVTGHPTRYVPMLCGDWGRMQAQLRLAREEGIDTVMMAPMLSGVATLQAIAREWPDMAILAHPSMTGGGQIAPELLFGKLFRLWGADALIFANYGGRFGFSQETCRRLSELALAPNPRQRAAVPTPAGGMELARVPELLDFFGRDVMLLIGGSLLLARERIPEEGAVFHRAVVEYFA